ncbi:hypothetical protein ACI784_25170 [Geodermatophilus sp. SYSU D01186]
MGQRWERTLAEVEAEAPRAAAEARGTDPVAAVRAETQSYADSNGRDTRTIAAPAQTHPDGGATGSASSEPPPGPADVRPRRPPSRVPSFQEFP